jgi:hypothetical protein
MLRVTTILLAGLLLGALGGWFYAKLYYQNNIDLLMVQADALVLERDLRYLSESERQLRCKLAGITLVGLDTMTAASDLPSDLLSNSHVKKLTLQSLTQARNASQKLDLREMVSSCAGQ